MERVPSDDGGVGGRGERQKDAVDGWIGDAEASKVGRREVGEGCQLLGLMAL
jgi:hypothetical protein